MMRLLARWGMPLAVLLLVAGCGSTDPSSGGKDAGAKSTDTKNTGEAERTSKVGECPVDSPALVSARIIATVDLDGDGQGDSVRLTAADGDCPNLLFAQQHKSYVAARLPVGEPPLTTGFAVYVPGRTGALLVTRQDHPRGGFQLRLYAAGEGRLAELKVGSRSLVPFVALDVQEHPLSIDCTDGGVVLTEAVPQETRGAGFAWDIKRTSYAVDGTEVTAGETQEIADNVPPGQLDAKYEDLVQHTAFKSCRAAD